MLVHEVHRYPETKQTVQMPLEELSDLKQHKRVVDGGWEGENGPAVVASA